MKVEKNISAKRIILFLLFLEHLFCYYFNNILNRENLVDSADFYTRALEVSLMKDLPYLLYPGRGMLLITSVSVKVLSNFHALSLFFSLVSFIPYYDITKKYFEPAGKENNMFLKITFLFILFMPSIHIWTAGIFKEAVVFPVMYLLLKGILKNRGNLMKADLILYIAVLFMIRPYLVCIIFAAYLITYFKYLNKKLLVLVSAFLLLVFLVLLTVFGSLNDLSDLNNLMSNINKFSQAQGNAVIDLETTNYFERLLYMMFRPLFFDAVTGPQLIYSFENIILIVWFLIFLYKAIIKKIKASYLLKNIFFVSSSIVWLFLGIYIYNYGLASRMKIMIIPFLMMGVLISIKQQPSEKNN